MEPRSVWWVFACFDFVAQTAMFVFFDAYKNFRFSQLCPQMIEIPWGLGLKLFFGRRRNVDEFKSVLIMMVETSLRGLPQQRESRSSRLDVLDLYGWVITAGWFPYNSKSWISSTKQKLEGLRPLPRLVPVAILLPRLDHNIALSRQNGEEESDRNCREGRREVNDGVWIVSIDAKSATLSFANAHENLLGNGRLSSIQGLWSFANSWSMSAYPTIVYRAVAPNCAASSVADWNLSLPFSAAK